MFITKLLTIHDKQVELMILFSNKIFSPDLIPAFSDQTFQVGRNRLFVVDFLLCCKTGDDNGIIGLDDRNKN